MSRCGAGHLSARARVRSGPAQQLQELGDQVVWHLVAAFGVVVLDEGDAVLLERPDCTHVAPFELSLLAVAQPGGVMQGGLDLSNLQERSPRRVLRQEALGVVTGGGYLPSAGIGFTQLKTGPGSCHARQASPGG
jgi:hypothetical protein